MTRRKRGTEDNDALDLLLDTVSNVFGGVMFLTLLAALLVISRGATNAEPPPEPTPEIPEDVPILDDRIVQMELEQTRSAVATQQRILKNLPSQPGDLEKIEQLASLQETLSDSRAELQRKREELLKTQNAKAEQEEQQAEQASKQRELAEQVAQKREELKQSEKVGKRTIAFRPLEASSRGEAILVLRYGRIYVFQNSPQSRSYNEADFFKSGSVGSGISITPKPHRGIPATQEGAQQIASRLRRSFPAHQYHVTIAVWNDSFGQFNMLSDALKAAGYRYRTIPSNDETKLTFGATASFVQ